ncbi:hypothetical protein GCM10022270_31040 [Terriglobus aquaticus]
MQIEWRSYGRGRETGVRAFALLPDAIALRFSDGSVYLYTHDRPGAAHVRAMRERAMAGRGLSTYVSQHVQQRYAGKLDA